jgi:hypothetical protein
VRRRQAPLPKVKSGSGPGGTGSPTTSLAAPPVRHHGPGRGQRQGDGARNIVASAGSPAPPRNKEAGLRAARTVSTGAQLAQVCESLRRKVLRPQTSVAISGWRAGASRRSRKHVSIRRLQISISERHGAAAAEQSVAAARGVRPKGRSAGGGESRARSGRCQPARRTTGGHAFSNVSNRGGGSIEVVW